MVRTKRSWNGPLKCCFGETQAYLQICKDAGGTDRAIRKYAYYLPRIGYYLLYGGYPSRIGLDIFYGGD